MAVITESASIIDYLESLFPSLENDLKNKIAQVASLKEFTTGQLLLDKGQYFKSTYLVVDGAIQMYREGDEGEEFLIYTIAPGDACALSMICALRNEKSELRAKALEPSKVISIPLKDMDVWMQEYSSWYHFVLETYRNKFESLLEVIDQVVFKSMDERLEFYVKNKIKQANSDIINITHQEIANDLNSSREVISRLLKKMENNGMVLLRRNQIEWLK